MLVSMGNTLAPSVCGVQLFSYRTERSPGWAKQCCQLARQQMQILPHASDWAPLAQHPERQEAASLAAGLCQQSDTLSARMEHAALWCSATGAMQHASVYQIKGTILRCALVETPDTLRDSMFAYVLP